MLGYLLLYFAGPDKRNISLTERVIGREGKGGRFKLMSNDTLLW